METGLRYSENFNLVLFLCDKSESGKDSSTYSIDSDLSKLY